MGVKSDCFISVLL